MPKQLVGTRLFSARPRLWQSMRETRGVDGEGGAWTISFARRCDGMRQVVMGYGRGSLGLNWSCREAGMD